MLKYFFSLLLFFLTSSLAFSNPILVDDIYARYNLSTKLLHYQGDFTENTEKTLPPFDKNRWKKVPDTGLNFGPGSDSDWFKVGFYSETTTEKTLFINCPTVPELTIWCVEEGSNRTQHVSLGLRRNFNVSLPTIKSGFTYNLKFEAGKKYHCYIYFKAYGQAHLSNVFLADADALLQEYHAFNGFLLIARTIFLTIILLGFLTFIFTKKISFLYYSLFFLFISLFAESELGSFWYFVKNDEFHIFALQKYWASAFSSLFIYLFFRQVLNEKKGVYLFHAKKWLHPLIFITHSSIFLYTLSETNHLFLASLSALLLIVTGNIIGFYNLALSWKRAKGGDITARYLFFTHLITTITIFFLISVPYLGIKNRYFNGFLMIYLIYIFEAFLFFLITIRKAVFILNERKELIIQNHIMQKQVSEALIKGQEIERNRIGKELYDDVGGNLAIISKTEEFQDSAIKNLIGDTIASVKGLSHGLVAPAFEHEEFKESIIDLGAKYNTAERKVHICFHEWEIIHHLTALNHCYRIVQELLQNAEKHSKASTIYIQFFGGKDTRIIYEDNGIGIPSSQKKEGIGLQNISYRAKAIGGEAIIEASEKGTFIRIENIKFE